MKRQGNQASQACDACRRRKLRCYIEEQARGLGSRCSRCAQHDLLCTYRDARLKRGPKTGSRLRAIRASQAAPVLEAESPQSESYSEVTSSLNELPDPLLDSLVDLDSLTPVFDSYVGTDTLINTWHTGGLEDGTRSAVSSIRQPGEMQLSKDDLRAEIWRCFAKCYERYPLWHLQTILARVENEEFLVDDDFRSLMFCFYLINDITAFRRNPAYGADRMEKMVEVVESSRSRSQQRHFAESPSLDAVIVSLVLFIAYSVRDRHHIAFYYLNEAAGLLRLIDADALGAVQRPLYHRLDCILFVTESASMPIYGNARRAKSTRCPEGVDSLESSMRWYGETEQSPVVLPTELAHVNLVALDNRAIKMLQSLVRIYGAGTAREISRAAPTAGDVIEDGTAENISLQEADVDITRQWQLCMRWQDVLTARKPAWSPRCSPSTLYTLQVIGLSALQHCGSVTTEGYRLIGHGKLAGLAVSISSVAAQLGLTAGCSSIIGDMLRIVAQADIERYFAPQMSEIELSVQGLLRPMALLDQDPTITRLGDDDGDLEGLMDATRHLS